MTIDTFYDRIHPDDREPTRAAIQQGIEGGRRYDVDYRTVDPATGATSWIRAIGRTFYAADGTPRRFDGVTLDVTEQRAPTSSCGTPTGGRTSSWPLLAHELRNPLAPIRNGLQVHAPGRRDGGRGRTKARAMMERQLTHMVRLIDDLLDVSRISRNKLDLRRERVAAGRRGHQRGRDRPGRRSTRAGHELSGLAAAGAGLPGRRPDAAGPGVLATC